MTATMGPPPPRNPKPSTEPESISQEESEPIAAKTTMCPPPPPPINDNPSTEPESITQAESEPISVKTTMGPPPLPPINPNQQNPQDEEKRSNSNSEPNSIEKPPASKQSSVPYTIPQWSGPPCHQFSLEVLKDGCILDQFKVYEKGAYMFGRVDLCDFVLEHPTISRFHAVLQYRSSGEAYLYDLGSTHGTSINKNQVTKRTYVDLRVGDVIRFGQSSRLYIFQGPSELMPPEKDLKAIREAKIREEMLDREASLRRARAEASLSDGISWGMGEDAFEEAEDDVDEVTWQTYKGQLTEKQEKTRAKIIKRTEKIAHMKKEIDAIRAKDIAQGGLTQGQQTQIARNEQRMTLILEELESLEETLNDSIRESMGARGRNISGGKRKGGPDDDDEDLLSDDDDFYDRTKKKPTVQKVGETESVETADGLLDKRDAITKEIEDKKELLLSQKNKMASETSLETETGDALDAYMSGISSQLVLDKAAELEKEISALQSELDRIVYLLKIADPTGEAAKKRDTKAQVQAPEKSKPPAAAVRKQTPKEPKKISTSTEPANSLMQKEGVADVSTESTKKPDENIVSDTSEGKKAIYTVAKPQWLGAVENKEIKESNRVMEVDTDKVDEFVDYKDRKKVLSSVDNPQVKEPSGIETATGLIIRKPKQVEELETDNKTSDQSTTSSSGAEEIAQNAVALLLKHTRGYHGDDEELVETPDMVAGKQSKKKERKAKRVLGPEKPSFLDSNPDPEYDSSWVPPEGQSGDGRTALNDRYGY